MVFRVDFPELAKDIREGTPSLLLSSFSQQLAKKLNLRYVNVEVCKMEEIYPKEYRVMTTRDMGTENPVLFDIYYSFPTKKPNETKISVKVSSEIFLEGKLEDILREYVLDRANLSQKNRT